jgi:hypothetical protein
MGVEAEKVNNLERTNELLLTTVKEFSAFSATRRFIILFIRASHLNLS